MYNKIKLFIFLFFIQFTVFAQNIRKNKNPIFNDPNFILLPGGVRFEDYNASNEDIYQFDKNSIIVFSCYANDNYKIGKWYIKGDTIKIRYEKHIGKRGVGEPNLNYDNALGYSTEEFNKYVDFVEIINESAEMNWKYIRNEFKKYHGEFEFTNYDPNLNLTSYNKRLKGNYDFASFKLLSKDELKQYNMAELKYIRNEIFARYGYIFKTSEMKSYFSKKEWYKPTNENVDEYLTEIERKNILIKELEKNLKLCPTNK